MAAPNSRLLVAVDEFRAVVRVCGRASFVCSADFRTLIYDLERRGCQLFVLELSECTIMDSTFVGILARFAQKLGEPGNGKGRIVLWNPAGRIVDLLDNLGVKELFVLERDRAPLGTACDAVRPGPAETAKLEAARASLEAHQTLMEVNPANIPKFKEVTAYLAEDLKRLEKPGSGLPAGE